MNHTKKLIGFCIILVMAIILVGCTVTENPRPRPGIYATHAFMNYDQLGHHNYSCFIGENDGMVYTCRGGSIDIAHLRIAADNTWYLYNKTVKNLKKGNSDFTYSLNTDPSVFQVHVAYPANFDSLSKSQQERIINEVSLDAAQYFTFQMVQWHEILTWVGLKAFLFASQFQSAFAWEDGYSNLMGTVVGANAIRKGGNFNDAMDVALREELLKLDPQPAEVGFRAAANVKGKWYKSGVATEILLRNFSMGITNGTATPALYPGVCPNAQPMNYPVPKLDTAKRYGFKIDLEIKVNGFGGAECLKQVYANHKRGYVVPDRDFASILDCLEKDAARRGYLVIK